MASKGLHNFPRYLAGGGAMACSLYFLIIQRADLAVVAASLYFLLACAIDTLQARIPNSLNLLLITAGVTINTVATGWSGLSGSLAGLLLGIGLLLLPYLMGGFGAGDVKALGALGALLGPKPLLHVFVYMAFCGGIMALLHYIFNASLKQKSREWLACAKASALLGDPRLLKPEKTETLRFPYAAAIAFGYYSYLTWGGVL